MEAGASRAKGQDGRGSVKAGILVTGNEVLNAVIRDENSPWLSEQLAELGVGLDRTLVVPDDEGSIRDGLDHLARRGVDLILTTGGLGPTADDMTAATVAGFAGLEMVLDPGMEEKIAAILRKYAAARGIEIPLDGLDEANRKQAMVPRGAIPLDPVGTAPGLVVEVDQGPVIVVLPGPPRELRPMWKRAVETAPVAGLVERASDIETLRLRLFGTPESQLAQGLREIEAEGAGFEGLEITTCLRKGELEVDIRFRPEATDRAVALRDAVVERFEGTVFSLDGRTIDEIVAGALREGGRTVAVAESCSAGMLAARLAGPPGASQYFAGGVVSYSNEAKVDLLGVDPDLLAERGAVSPEVAREMARGALARFGADLAVAVTGIAGPGGGSDEKPVGFVCFHAEGDGLGEIAFSPTIPGGRDDVRERSALVGMHLIRRLLAGEGAPF